MSSSQATPPAFDSGKPKSSAARSWLIAVVLLALLGGGYYFYEQSVAKDIARNRIRRNDPMPVATASVKKKDYNVYIDAIGNVKALNTATIRTLVNGTLQKIRFTENSLVKTGALLAEVDPRPYEVQKAQAEGQLARDQALLTNAKLDMERYKDAAEAVTQQQVDTARSAVAQYEGAVMTDKAAVDSAKLQLTYCHISAPFDGRVGLRQVDEGNIVSTSDVAGIVVLTQVTPISAFFFVTENDLSALLNASGKNPGLTVEAYDSDKKHLIATGKLAAVDNQIDMTTGTVKLRANFENKNLELFPNKSVYVKLLVDTHKDALIVPTAAVQIADQDRFLYVVKSDDTVERRTVKVGKFDDRDTEILEGVKEGELIVTDGLDRLNTGSKVVPNAKKAAKAPADAAASKSPAGTDEKAPVKRHKKPDAAN